jgi:hypothetical protein
MTPEGFTHRVTSGWLRDLASEPTPADPWPCIRWDDQLLEDQIRFLNVQAELGITYNLAWGCFVERDWPVPLENVIHQPRREKLHAFTDAAHERQLKVLSGVGIYSWGFDEVIRLEPRVSRGHQQAMCPFQDAAWDWQRRVLDFLMQPEWNLDGISMQSSDQGRCECEDCTKRSPAEHHAEILVRCAEYVRSQRPDWLIGQAAWGLRIDEPDEFEHVLRLSESVDYMIEVRELTGFSGKREKVARELGCALGSVGGVFVEPPQHWDRLRWCVPCGLGLAEALKKLWEDGGRASEYFYRPFANPIEEVSWRTGARIMQAPQTTPEAALQLAVEAVYGTTGPASRDLTDWFARVEDAYFSRSDFEMGRGPLSLEPLRWEEDPAVPGPPIYLENRIDSAALSAYADELRILKNDFRDIKIPNIDAAGRTNFSIDGTLSDITTLS